MQQRVVLFGAGKGAEMARRHLAADGRHEVVGHIVDREHLTADRFAGLPVIPVEEAVERFPPGDHWAFAPLGAAGMNAMRTEKYLLLKSLGYRFASFIHPSNRMESVKVGENCFILENQSVNLDVVIGDNVVIWSGCQIGDRTKIHDNVFMAAHVAVAGDTVIGENAYLGTNATVANGVTVGRRCFVGANALIADDTKEGSVHVVEPTPPLGIDSSRFVKMIRHPI